MSKTNQAIELKWLMSPPNDKLFRRIEFDFWMEQFILGQTYLPPAKETEG